MNDTYNPLLNGTPFRGAVNAVCYILLPIEAAEADCMELYSTSYKERKKCLLFRFTSEMGY